jgi:DegV family protein with EDD domain
MIKIVTDSTCDLPAEVVKQYDITVMALRIHFGTETLLDGVDITKEAFYDRLRAAPQLPTTSQPSAGEFCEVFQPLVEAGHEVVGIYISSGLSGTCASATAACGLMPGAPITVIDPQTTSAGLGWMVWEAARMAKAGADVPAIKARIEELQGKMAVYFVVDTLEYLRKGGRIGGAAALLGTMVQLKPILMIHEGKVEPLEKVRTHGKAIDRMIQLITEKTSGYNTVHAAVLHARVEDEARVVMDRVQAAIPACKESYIAEIGAALGTHAGPGVIGVAAYGD